MPFRHGKSTKVLFGEYDLSRFLTEARQPRSADTPETTTFGALNKTYVVGHPDDQIALTGYFDGDVGATDPVLAAQLAVETSIPLTVGIEGSAVGRRALLHLILESAYDLSSPVAGVVGVTANLVGAGPVMAGVLLKDVAASVTATGNGTNVDNGALTSNGGIAHLHVPTNTRNGTTIWKVQHSVDNSAWVDLVTFATVGAATIAKERIVVASGTTVNRHLRAQWTVAGSTGSTFAAVAFARG
jgi:hypothetical protein